MSQPHWINRRVESFGQTEIDNFDCRNGTLGLLCRHAPACCPCVSAVGFYQNQIRRFQIAMDQSTLFYCGQCGGDLLGDIDGGAGIERPGAANALLECLAVNQFYRVKKSACLLANPEL